MVTPEELEKLENRWLARFAVTVVLGGVAIYGGYHAPEPWIALPMGIAFLWALGVWWAFPAEDDFLAAKEAFEAPPEPPAVPADPAPPAPAGPAHGWDDDLADLLGDDGRW